MKILEFLNDVDWSRNILLFIIYIVVILFCFLFYLVPIIEGHKVEMLNYKKSQNLDSTINRNVEALENNMQTMMDKESKIYKNMRNEISVDILQTYISKFLINSKITDEGISYRDDGIQIKRIHIIGDAKNTKDIISLVDSLVGLDNSIRISFPVKVEKNNHLLKIEFSAEVYYSEYEF